MAHIYDKFPALKGKDTDNRTRRYITPQRIVWTSASEGANVQGTENLLIPKEEQISFGVENACILKNEKGKPKASLLVDYGREINGTVRVLAWHASNGEEPKNRVNIRIRRGESVSEAMTPLGERNTTNDHANRDIEMNIGFLSGFETNESGFRFMRIDLLDEEAELVLKSVNATFIFLDVDYIGSFECSDPLLNSIWDTAAYTAQLNMQEYLWDGIKRDRLVWIGDMHTEVMTILCAFGYNAVVPKSLDLAKKDAPISEESFSWMNGMPSYSLWWLLIQYQWYMHTGDYGYLCEQKAYMEKLLSHLVALVDENGIEQLPAKFLDWPNCGNEAAEHCGIQGLLCLTLQRGAYLLREMKHEELAAVCENTAEGMKRHVAETGGSKSAGALSVLGGLSDAEKMNRELLSVNGARGYSTFFGYYILKAKILAGDAEGALDAIREYWGGMLKMGATSFWEDFQLEWTENAAPITELVPEGKADIHGDFGAHCYVKFRHSLCHGWASGPSPFLSHYVLGIQVEEPGCKTVRIQPQLGNLTYARGTYPTPYGTISVSHSKNADGSIHTDITAPDEITVIRA